MGLSCAPSILSPPLGVAVCALPPFLPLPAVPLAEATLPPGAKGLPAHPGLPSGEAVPDCSQLGWEHALREGLGPSPSFLTEAPLACELRGQGHSQGPIAALG